MLVIKISTENTEPDALETDGKVEDWHQLIGCRSFGIHTMKIAGKWYDFIVDDEALLKERPKITAITKDCKPMLVGNYVICGFDDEKGTEETLNALDVIHIFRNSVVISAADNSKEKWAAIKNVEY